MGKSRCTRSFLRVGASFGTHLPSRMMAKASRAVSPEATLWRLHATSRSSRGDCRGDLVELVADSELHLGSAGVKLQQELQRGSSCATVTVTVQTRRNRARGKK